MKLCPRCTNFYDGDDCHCGRSSFPVGGQNAAMTETETQLIGTDDVAEICGVSRRTVEDWLDRGWLRPEATIARRHIWRRSTIETWNAADRPAFLEHAGDLPTLDVVGVDELAELRGVKRRTVLSWRGTDRLPEPDVTVSGTLIWLRATIDRWLEQTASATT